MNTETEYLRTIAEDIAAKHHPAISEPLADHRILLEARRLEKAVVAELRSIDNHTQRDTFHNDTLVKLVDICDTLYNIHRAVSPDTQVLLELLTAVKQVIPGEIAASGHEIKLGKLCPGLNSAGHRSEADRDRCNSI
jgi:hypothetical protein